MKKSTVVLLFGIPLILFQTGLTLALTFFWYPPSFIPLIATDILIGWNVLLNWRRFKDEENSSRGK